MRILLSFSVLFAFAPAAFAQTGPFGELGQSAQLASSGTGAFQNQKNQADEFSLDLPKPEKLFQIQSEKTLRQQIVQDAQVRGVKRTEFPQEAGIVSKVVDFSKLYPPRAMQVPPEVICYQTLYFQDITRERYVESWGCGEPFREAFLFYGTAATLPGTMLFVPPCGCECWSYPFLP